MDFPQAQLDNSAPQLDESPQAQLETEIAFVRHEIARLKGRLKRSFDEQGSFAALGEELRQATERLGQIEAELRSAQLEAREEVWWCSRKRPAGAAAKLPKSSRYSERKAR